MTKEFNQLEFLREAVRIDSSDGVEEMRDFLIETLEKHGYESEVDEHGNTLCSRGSGEPHLVLNTHIDTVAPHVEFDETDERILGRGSCDAKGPLSALLKSFIEADIDGKLSLAVTCDEENIDADAFLVGEPTDLDPCIAARGWTKVEIDLTGEPAHASEPENGVSAIQAASKAVLSLQDFDEKFGYENDLLPDPNLSATIIEGGEAENQIPETAKVTVDRRIVPPETPEKFAEKMRNYLEENLSTEAEFKVSLPEATEPLSAFETDSNSNIVKIIEEQTGNDSRIFDAATEASRFNEADVVVFGPGVLADEEGGVAHAKREYVSKHQVREAGEIAVKAVEEYLNQK
jgi:acetylornithine deacetylase